MKGLYNYVGGLRLKSAPNHSTVKIYSSKKVNKAS